MRLASLLPALALLGCSPRAASDAQAPACSAIKAEWLAARLRAADPHEQWRIVVDELMEVCNPTQDPDVGSPDEIGLDLFTRMCPAEPEIQNELYSLSAAELYERCDLERLQIIERSEYLRHERPNPLVWSHYQWFIENGMTPEQARVITRAELRGAFAHWARLPDLQLPAVDAMDAHPAAARLQISAHEMSFDRKSVMSLDNGEIAREHVVDGLVEPLALPLETEQIIAEARGPSLSGLAWLSIAVDRRTPFSTLERVAHTARHFGYQQLWIIVEPQLFDYRKLPLTLSPADAAVYVHVNADGYRVSASGEVRDVADLEQLTTVALAACDAGPSHDAAIWAAPSVSHDRFAHALKALLRGCDWVLLAAEP